MTGTGRPVMRWIHSADWQLGMTRYYLSAEAQARYSAARIDAIRSIGEHARRCAAEFVLVCGDVFESNTVAPQVVRRSLEAMGGMGVRVLLLPGNHDPLDASSVFTSREFRTRCPPNVTVLTPGRHEIADGVEVVAAPWLSKRPVGDLVAQALDELPADDTVRILAGHGALDVLSQNPADPRLIALRTVEAALADGRIHYLALGDRHSRTAIGATGRVHYSGTPEVTAFDEIDPGQVLLVELSAERVEVTPHRVGRWSFQELLVALHGSADITALRDRLAAVPDKDCSVIRLGLSGTLTVAEKAACDDMLAVAGDLFAALQLRDDSPVTVVLDEAALGDLGVGGYAASAAQELAESAQREGPAGATAGAALTLLHRLAGASR